MAFVVLSSRFLYLYRCPLQMGFPKRFSIRDVLDASTNRPVAGVLTKQIVFNIRKVEAGDVPGQIIDTHTASNVSVRDGVFTLRFRYRIMLILMNPMELKLLFKVLVVVEGFQPFH